MQKILKQKKKPMTTMTIQIENPSIIPSLRKVLNAIDGVAILPQRHKSVAKQDKPNATTIKAIKDAKAGKTFKASSVDDLINQCLN